MNQLNGSLEEELRLEGSPGLRNILEGGSASVLHRPIWGGFRRDVVPPISDSPVRQITLSVLPNRYTPLSHPCHTPLHRSRSGSGRVLAPVAAVFGALAVQLLSPILPYTLGFAAGAMLFVVVAELIPEAHESEQGEVAVVAVLAGFLLMMILDVLV